MAIEQSTRNVSDVITAVKRQFGDESGVQITDADIFRWIDDAQRDIVIKNPEVNAVLATINVTADTGQYTLLSELPNILKIHSIHYNGKLLPSMTFTGAQEYLIGETGSPNSGTPQFWYIYAGVLHLWPVPTADLASGISIYYSKQPTRVTTSGDLLSVPDNYYKAVVDFCLAQAYELDENLQLSQYKDDQYSRSVTEMGNDVIEQMRVYPTINLLPEDL